MWRSLTTSQATVIQANAADDTAIVVCTPVRFIPYLHQMHLLRRKIDRTEDRMADLTK